MQYRWISQKPLHRAANARTKIRAPGQIPEVYLTEIMRGTVFEPSEGEIRSFGDLMEPVMASLVLEGERGDHAALPVPVSTSQE